MIGVFSGDIDLTTVLICAFVLFWFALVYYIRREDKREGYPLEEAIPTLNHGIVGWPMPPPAKTYNLLDGTTATMPHEYERRLLKAKPRALFPGAALYPVGDPLVAGVGPSSYALRRDEPFRMRDGSPQLEPLREATDYKCLDPDMDPRGRKVLGLDFEQAGTCVDIWVDKGSKILRYIEVELLAGGRRLVPIFYATVRRNGDSLRIDAITGAQFVKAPELRTPTEITAREEDFVNGFFAGGHMYALQSSEAFP